MTLAACCAPIRHLVGHHLTHLVAKAAVASVAIAGAPHVAHTIAHAFSDKPAAVAPRATGCGDGGTVVVPYEDGRDIVASSDVALRLSVPLVVGAGIRVWPDDVGPGGALFGPVGGYPEGVASVPEPSSLVLVGAATAMLMGIRYRRDDSARQ